MSTGTIESPLKEKPTVADRVIDRARRAAHFSHEAQVLKSLAAETKGLPGAEETFAVIGKTFRRADGERVARLAVEKLALLAAAAALNGLSPRHAELFASTRLAADRASMYGAVELESGEVRALLERALP